MSSEHTMNPTGGVLSRRVMEEPPSQPQLLERILSSLLIFFLTIWIRNWNNAVTALVGMLMTSSY